MAYRFAPPPAPKVPQTTPASIRARLRAPIVNPYDKFTQPEFDAWIGDLTSALKRALGREDLPPRAQFSEARRHERDTSAYDDEGVMEDSFAEVKERRAAKGKERAIMTDEEEVESMILGPDLEPLEDSEEEESDIQDERWGHPDHFGWARAAQDEDELAEASDGDSDILSVQQGPDEAIEISSDEDEDELVADGSSSPAAADNEEEYEDEDEEEARSDEEEEEEEDELQYEDVEEDRTPDHLQVHEEVEIEEEEAVQPKDAEPKDSEPYFARIPMINLSNVRATAFPPSQGAAGVVEIQDPWTGPSTHERDFYSGGDIPQSSLRTGSAHMLPTEEDEIEQVEDDTGAEFPPVSAFPHSVELLDPWDGPRTYAEDFYSGGEIPPNSAYLSPSHLTPLATTPRDELDLGLDITLLLTPETATVTPVVIDVGGDRELKFQFEAGGEGDVLVLGADEVENVPTFTMTDDTGMEGAESHALHETDFDAPAFEDLYGSLGEEAAPEVRAEAERVEETQPNDVVADLITPEVSLDTANRGHVDWNHPPAFLSGRAASGPGHLKAPETQSDSRSHIIEGNRSISPEVLEISDDSVEVDVGSSVHITETEATIHTPTLQEDYEESDGRAQEDDLDFTDSFTSGNILASSAIPSVDDMSFEVQDEQRESLFQELESMYMANQAAFNNLQSSALEDDTGVSQNANAVLEFNFLEGAVAEDLPLTAEEAEILEVFTQFDKPGQNGTPHTDVPDTTAEATDVLQGAEIAELDLDASEEVEREDYEDEEPAVQEMHEEVVGMLYVVTEFDTDDEQEGIDELIYDDVATDAEDGAVMVLRYEVEEVITEGRRTVDPEDPEESLAFETKQPTPEPPAVVDVANSLPALDVAEDVQQPEAPSTSESADVLLSSRRPGAVESEDSAYPSKDGETTEGIATNALDLEYPLSPSFPEMDVTTSTDEPQVVITSADAQEEQSTPALETGIPMPISADPSVPDPAEAQEDDSMADDTTSGPSTASKFAIPNAIPRSLFSRLSAHKSGSGLFTPLTEQDSSPAGSIHTSEDGLVVEQSLAEPDRSSPVEESDLPRGQSEGVPRDVVISEVDGRDAKADALSTLVLREDTSILAPPVDAPEESKTSVVVAQKVSYETAAGAHDPDLDADGDVDSDYEPNDSIRSSRQGDSPPRVKDGDVDPANHLARQLPTDPGTEVTSSHHTIEQGLDVSVPVEAQSPPQVNSSEPTPKAKAQDTSPWRAAYDAFQIC
ncbi:hypothetical protein EW026_g1348 [Hermanssonia centrifuga]|uniref:Uncharacterized protein n=1 Tax=Hermanssonia centrifuga TaxID=98765 RepID=A0A4V3XBA9_9APHY|nr:hypothetical protein EW026_g1348 [Hermanssonia centrifuga]